MSNPSLYELSDRKNRSKLLKSAFARNGHVSVEAYDSFYSSAARTRSGFDRIYETVLAEVKRNFDAVCRDGEVVVTFYSSPYPQVIETLVLLTPNGDVKTLHEYLMATDEG